MFLQSKEFSQHRSVIVWGRMLYGAECQYGTDLLIDTQGHASDDTDEIISLIIDTQGRLVMILMTLSGFEKFVVDRNIFNDLIVSSHKISVFISPEKHCILLVKWCL